MKKLSSLKFFHLAFFLIVGLSPSTGAAQVTVSVDQPLSFGNFVIIDFGSVAEIDIANDGSFSINANVYTIDPPTLGEYTVNAPSNVSSLYTISVPSSVTIGGGSGGSFTLDQIEVRPTTLMTDASGEDQFTLSGRLRSVGGGTFYSDDNYSNSFNITFNF